MIHISISFHASHSIRIFSISKDENPRWQKMKDMAKRESVLTSLFSHKIIFIET